MELALKVQGLVGRAQKIREANFSETALQKKVSPLSQNFQFFPEKNVILAGFLWFLLGSYVCIYVYGSYVCIYIYICHIICTIMECIRIYIYTYIYLFITDGVLLGVPGWCGSNAVTLFLGSRRAKYSYIVCVIMAL